VRTGDLACRLTPQDEAQVVRVEAVQFEGVASAFARGAKCQLAKTAISCRVFGISAASDDRSLSSITSSPGVPAATGIGRFLGKAVESPG
jgi:hypothetical protein